MIRAPKIILARGKRAAIFGGLALLAIVVSATCALADTTTATNTFGTPTQLFTSFGGTINFNTPNSVTADGTVTIALAQYHPYEHNFAQLQSLNISYTINATQNYSIRNTTGSPRAFTDQLVAVSDLMAPGSTTQIIAQSTATTNLGQVVPASTTITGSATPTGNTDTSTTIPGSTTYTHIWTAADLASFTGGGNVTFDILGAGGENFGSSGFSHSVQTFISGTVLITYTFTPVPEPSSWAFLSVGCLTGGLALRRRRLLSRSPLTK